MVKTIINASESIALYYFLRAVRLNPGRRYVQEKTALKVVQMKKMKRKVNFLLQFIIVKRRSSFTTTGQH